MSKYQFVNPYNFIPLNSDCPPVSSEKDCNYNYTGVIEYSLLTKTPLFIPNTSSDNAFKTYQEGEKKKHKSYDFFSYVDLYTNDNSDKIENPVIPGSEIRGMFRSYFEILTNSCMSAIEDNVFTKRTDEFFKPGLIVKNENKGFDLYDAKDCLVRTKGENSLEDDWENDKDHYIRKCYIQNNIKEGTKVYFKFIERKGKKDKTKTFQMKPLAQEVMTEETEGKEKEKNIYKVGYLIKGADGPKMKKEKDLRQQKHCCHVFTLNDEQKEPKRKNIDSDPYIFETLYKTIDIYLKNIQTEDVEDNIEDGRLPVKTDSEEKSSYWEYREQFEKYKSTADKDDGFPVYYSEVLGNIMLSPACKTREIYKRKLSDMIPNHIPCGNKEGLCPACALFGKIEGDSPRKSKIRFSDLTLNVKNPDPNTCFLNKVTLPPLATPQLSNTEFYLHRPKDAVFWTYDYYIDAKGKLLENKEGINGRKFYWHNMITEIKPDSSGDKRKNLTTTIRPLDAGVIFDGKLYFRNLSKTELDQLIYLLNAGDKGNLKDRTHGYKLGKAKPLGLGSVAVAVTDVILRTIEKNDISSKVERKKYHHYELENYQNPEFDEVILKNFTRITNFNELKGQTVDYPRMEEGGDIFNWFTHNHVKIKEGKVDYKKMPTKRTEMGFAEYMEPMDAMLTNTKSTFNKSKLYKAIVIEWDDKNVFIDVEGEKGEIYFKNISGAKKGNLDQLFTKNQTLVVQFTKTSTYKGIHTNQFIITEEE